MWKAMCVVVGILLIAIVEMGLSLWWWVDTSSGTWECAPVKYVMGFGWGMAPILVWVVTFFLIAGFFYKRDGSPRWE